MSVQGSLDVLAAALQRATSVPMSASCVVNRAELLALVEQARAELPPEVEEAGTVLARHDEIVAEARTEAARIVAEARVKADSLVEAEAVVTRSRLRAADVVQAASVEATRLMRDADDYCDRRLAALEIELERALGQVSRGRQRLVERRDDPAELVAAQVAGAAELDVDAGLVTVIDLTAVEQAEADRGERVGAGGLGRGSHVQ
jgi:cell division septum initiation protein DivIVA